MPPVEDRPIHPSVIKTDIRAGCHSMPRVAHGAGYWIKERKYNLDGTYDMVDTWIPYTFSYGCRQNLPLPECEGCTSTKDIEWMEKWK